jgi:CRISPR-associated protein Cmr6
MSRREIFGSALTLQPTTHAGLWLERFVPDLETAGVQAAHLEGLVRNLEAPPSYPSFFRRRQEAIRLLPPKTLMAKATVRARLSLGLGQESVLETSITLHHTFGVPYLPGSALKGLAARAARQKLDTPWDPDEEGGPYSIVFGRLEDAGFVTFHDALWIPEGSGLPLDVDVLTVHHADYYGSGAPPTEWDDPNPVPFLTAHGSFEIALTGPERWVDLAFDLLCDALEKDGVGAKEGIYGYLTVEGRPVVIPPSQPSRPRARVPWGPRVQSMNAGNAGPIVDSILTEYEGDAEELRLAALAILKRLNRPSLRAKRDEKPWIRPVFKAAGEELP